MLVRLLSRLDTTAFHSEVVSLTPGGALAQAVRHCNVPVHCVGMTPGSLNLSGLYRLSALIRRLTPDVIHTWMYHANLAGSIASMLSGVSCPVVWAVHNASLARGRSKRLTIWTDKTCSRFSRLLASRIVYCSATAQKLHCAQGYDRGRSRVIPNGFDTAVFQPDPAARASVRRELGIDLNCKLVGLFGRFHPDKNHRMFVEAAARLRSRPEGVQFVLCGQGVSPDNVELIEWLADARLTARTHLLGQRVDMARLTAALDVACLSSHSEAFPLVLGEALACGIPCVSTDVGDARDIVGAAGRIVPTQRPDLFAAAIDEVLSLRAVDHQRLGQLGRDHVLKCFNIEDVARKYEGVYLDVSPITSASLSHVGS